MTNAILASQAHDRLVEIEKFIYNSRPSVLVLLTDIPEYLMIAGITLPILYVKILPPQTIDIISNVKKDLLPSMETIETDYVVFGNSLEIYLSNSLSLDPHPQTDEALNQFVFAAIWQRIRSEFETINKTAVASPNDVMLRFYEELRKKGSHLDLLESTNEAVRQHRRAANFPADFSPDDPVQHNIPKQVEALFVGRLFAPAAKTVGLEEACKLVFADHERWLTPPIEPF